MVDALSYARLMTCAILIGLVCVTAVAFMIVLMVFEKIDNHKRNRRLRDISLIVPKFGVLGRYRLLEKNVDSKLLDELSKYREEARREFA